MGMGIGAAMTGLRVIIEGMNMGFLLLAYNQISNNAGMLHYTSGGQYKVGPLTSHKQHRALPWCLWLLQSGVWAERQPNASLRLRCAQGSGTAHSMPCMLRFCIILSFLQGN